VRTPGLRAIPRTWILLLGACVGSPTSSGDSSFVLLFEASTLVPVAGVRQRCTASAEVRPGASFPASWAGELDFAVSRSVEVGDRTVRADTMLRAVPVTVTLLDEGPAVLRVDPRLGEESSGSVQDPRWDGVLAAGPWTCGPTFPFATHPALVQAGQDPERAYEGQWYLMRAR